MTNENNLLNEAATTNSEKTEKTSALDLAAPGVASRVAARVAEDINKYVIREYDGGHRNHLGASLIGHDCKRYLWYIFRWAFRETYKDEASHARMQRLFNRGHREEARFIEWLEGIGAEVYYENRAGLGYHAESDSYFIEPDENAGCWEQCDRITPDNPAYLKHVARAKADGLEFPQFRVSAVKGHFGGSLDAIIKLPERYNIPEWILGEFKTNSTGRAFDKLGESGMAVAKPQHFAQTSTYGSDPQYNFRYVLYFNVNKNDDSLHIEMVKLNPSLGDQMRMKAETIILSQVPPPRLSDNPTYSSCTYCAAHDICHKGALPEKNCRSCKHAVPIDGGQWHCEHFNGTIPKEFIPKGCENWEPITTLKK